MVQILSSHAALFYQQSQTIDDSIQVSGINKSGSPSPTSPQAQQEDTVNLSGRARPSPTSASQKNEENDASGTTSSQANANLHADSDSLTSQELQELQKLRTRDTEVRSHEQAHLTSAGQYSTGGPTFTYQTGPDGKRYAIGGEVSIDVSKENNPEATIMKMRAIRRAALAPANPSGTDRQVAAQAAMFEAQAQREKQQATAKEAPATVQAEPSGQAPTEENSQITQVPPPQTSRESSNDLPETTISVIRRQMMITTYQKISSLV